MDPHLSPPALGEERVPADEPALIESLLAILRAIQEQKDRREQPVPRTVHPKQHGCVLGELRVAAGLPDGLRHGLFEGPGRYPALVRFSNSKQSNDELPDAHGMAVKVWVGPGVPGGTVATQDLVLVDHPVFFARDVGDMLPLAEDFRRLMVGGPLEKAGVILKGALSPDYRYRLIRKMAAKRPDSPLDISYWSTTPVRYGSAAAKFLLRPVLDRLPRPAPRSKDKLRLALAAQLAETEAQFEVFVLRQIDPRAMPVEDPTVDWEEQGAKPEKVGSLVLPRQTFDSPEQRPFGEQLSFTPWHTIDEHRPLGGINRARKRIYDVMSARRDELNHATRREPTPEEVKAVYPLARDMWP